MRVREALSALNFLGVYFQDFIVAVDNDEAVNGADIVMRLAEVLEEARGVVARESDKILDEMRRRDAQES